MLKRGKDEKKCVEKEEREWIRQRKRVKFFHFSFSLVLLLNMLRWILIDIEYILLDYGYVRVDLQ